MKTFIIIFMTKVNLLFQLNKRKNTPNEYQF